MGQETTLIQKLIQENPALQLIDKDTAFPMIEEDKSDLLEQNDAYIWIYDAVTGDKICEKPFKVTEKVMTESAEGAEEAE